MVDTKLEAIKYKRGSLQLLDQLKIPGEMKYDAIRNTEDGWNAIREMRVRGAPAIAIAAALSLAVDLTSQTFTTATETREFIIAKLKYLKTSRPTAVNLFNAADHLMSLVNALSDDVDASTVVQTYLEEAEHMMEADVADNMAIGNYGAELFSGDSVHVLTHCNTGSLATACHGTALGVIRSLHQAGRLAHAYCTETRPYNQGARLTAFELVYEKMPATLVCDSMASWLMKTKPLDGVVVGADRVVANGDTANKIGTYQLAITCKHHNVPFYVASPISSFDLSTATGEGIKIEERPENEVTFVGGQRIAAEGIRAWNPAFDVTPAELITAIITELGVIYPQKGTFACKDWIGTAQAKADGPAHKRHKH